MINKLLTFIATIVVLVLPWFLTASVVLMFVVLYNELLLYIISKNVEIIFVCFTLLTLPTILLMDRFSKLYSTKIYKAKTMYIIKDWIIQYEKQMTPLAKSEREKENVVTYCNDLVEKVNRWIDRHNLRWYQTKAPYKYYEDPFLKYDEGFDPQRLAFHILRKVAGDEKVENIRYYFPDEKKVSKHAAINVLFGIDY